MLDRKILIIIPAYNEESNIDGVIRDIRNYFPEGDILVIDDCSKDGTVQLLKGMGVNYLSFINNLGIGAGVQAGYLYAYEKGYDIAVQFDGDGQHRAEYIERLVRPIEESKADYVIGSRFIENEGFQSSMMRRAGIRFLSLLIKLLCGLNIMDVTSGMRAVNKTLIQKFAHDYAQDYPEPEAIVSASVKGSRIIEVPVRMRERQGGKSSINIVRSVYYMLKVSLALILCAKKDK